MEMATSESTQSLYNPPQSDDNVAAVDDATSSLMSTEEARQLDGEEENVTVFNQLDYLGRSRIADPDDEGEMLRMLALLNDNKCPHVRVVLRVPKDRNGVLVLNEEPTEEETGSTTMAVTVAVSTFVLHRIRYVTRGALNTDECKCFAFTYTRQMGSSEATAVHTIHAFRCHLADSVGRILCCFAVAFKSSGPSTPRTPIAKEQTTSAEGEEGELDYTFEAQLEVSEEDPAKHELVVCPVEKNCFKLRRGRPRSISLSLRQTSGSKTLPVVKCFGLLLAAGRNVRHGDMHLLDIQSMTGGTDAENFVIEALWDPRLPHFEVLNTETPRDTRVFMTVAADMVIEGIADPLRFTVECKARIYHEHERFWIAGRRRPVIEQYSLTVNAPTGETSVCDVLNFESSTMRDNRSEHGRVSLNGNSWSASGASQLVERADEDDSDGDEPLLSGSGAPLATTADDVMREWRQIIDTWRATHERPANLSDLVRDGMPNCVRRDVWPLLTGVTEGERELLEQSYTTLSLKECEWEQTIMRDVHRTFPAHEYFADVEGEGQAALYRISQAYSLYDVDVGYCQGLSFLAASLLLQLDEPSAFCTLVKIMYDYGLRELFMPGFETLHVRLYQLGRLIQDYLPALHQHLRDVAVETHMFASQWFLTLFTAKFPLNIVYHIVDLFLMEGVNTIFHISLALLRAASPNLLQLDFEGTLKYFRVALPRQYRGEENSKLLIAQAIKLKISHKRLQKYETEHRTMKEEEMGLLDPLGRAERENVRLGEAVKRLDRENDNLAHDLVTTKICMRNTIDAAEDNMESLQKQVESTTRNNGELSTELGEVMREYNHVKAMCRKEIDRMEGEDERSHTIIENYKQICTDLSLRLERSQTEQKQTVAHVIKCVSDCASCSSILCTRDSQSNAVNGLKVVDGGGEGGNDDLSTNDVIRSLELQLAQTKLKLVESECRNQDLMHSLNSALTPVEEDKATTGGRWLKKAINWSEQALKGGGNQANPDDQGGH